MELFFPLLVFQAACICVHTLEVDFCLFLYLLEASFTPFTMHSFLSTPVQSLPHWTALRNLTFPVFLI